MKTLCHRGENGLLSSFLVPGSSGRERLPQSLEMEVRLRATDPGGARLARKDMKIRESEPVPLTWAF